MPSDAATGAEGAEDPEAILRVLLGLDPGLRRRAYYGERSVFFNPGDARPLGMIFASVKDRDGPNDATSELSRPGVFRLAFCLGGAEYADRFGAVPPRPAKGGVVDLGGYDPARLHELTPHPVYAWMRWVQVLSPTPDGFRALLPLLEVSLAAVKDRWRRREAR